MLPSELQSKAKVKTSSPESDFVGISDAIAFDARRWKSLRSINWGVIRAYEMYTSFSPSRLVPSTLRTSSDKLHLYSARTSSFIFHAIREIRKTRSESLAEWWRRILFNFRFRIYVLTKQTIKVSGRLYRNFFARLSILPSILQTKQNNLKFRSRILITYETQSEHNVAVIRVQGSVYDN